MNREGITLANCTVRRNEQRSLQELIDRKGPWRNIEHAEWATLNYISWFNNPRIHEALDYVPPVEFEAHYYGSKESERLAVQKRNGLPQTLPDSHSLCAQRNRRAGWEPDPQSWCPRDWRGRAGNRGGRFLAEVPDGSPSNISTTRIEDGGGGWRGFVPLSTGPLGRHRCLDA